MRRVVVLWVLVVLLVNGVGASVSASADSGSAGGSSSGVSSSGDELSRARSAAVRSGSRVEVGSLASEVSATFANPDGSLSYTVSPVPSRVKRAGGWVPVDLSLVVGVDGLLVPKAGPADVRVGGGGSGLVHSVGFGKSSVGLSWPGLLPTPVVSGSSARFPDVLVGTDLLVDVSAVGVETSLVVKERPAKPLGVVGFGLATSGVAARMDERGRATYTDVSGREVAFGSTSWAWDSYSDPVSGLPHMVPVTTQIRGGSLLVTVPDAFLADPSTVFPVTVDPPTSTIGRVAFAYIDSAYPNYSQVNVQNDPKGLHVGTFNGGLPYGSVNRAMYIFPASNLLGQQIISAQLSTTLNYSWSCTATDVQVWHTGSWGGGLTWNNRPTEWGPWTSQKVAKGYSLACPGGAVGFDVTPMVQGLVRDGWPNYYVQLRAASETDNYGWKKFSPDASLTVQYNTPPGVPGGWQMSPCGPSCGSNGYVTSSATPTFSVSAVDAQGENLAYGFFLSQGSVVPADILNTPRFREGWSAWVPSGGVGSWTPAALPAGQYVVIAWAHDGLSYSAAWSSFVFTVDTSPPVAAGVSGVGPFSVVPTSFAGVVGRDVETVTITGAADVYGFLYTVRNAPVTAAGFPAGVPACGSSAGGFTFVCGTSATVSVTATDRVSSVSVLPIDRAGNRGVSASSLSMYAVADQAPVGTGHAWLVQDGPASCKNPAAADAGSGVVLDAVLTTSLSDGVCWAPPAAGLPFVQGWSDPHVVTFSSTATGYAKTAGPALADTSKAFTVGAWLYPTASSATQAFTALAQEGVNEQVFYLQNSLSGWAFCMSFADTVDWAGDCLFTQPTAPVNAWTFVAATWDPVNKQMRLFTSTDGSAGTPIVTSHASSWTANGPLYMGRDRIGSTIRSWRGQIASPMVFPGVLTSDQLSNMAHQVAPAAW